MKALVRIGRGQNKELAMIQIKPKYSELSLSRGENPRGPRVGTGDQLNIAS
jgi:hypothetical protein